MKSRIELFHDFNKLLDGKEEGQVSAPLVCYGTVQQMEKENIVLSEGQIVTLIDPDDVDENGKPDRLEVEAQIRFDQEHNCWVGDFTRAELKYRSEK
ncbi:hypothetical protein [Paraglaciecola sp. MB-3u-78]|uniref:hypothetical protein n=1 Tax=Paraglaciecola sp. MB-3u-78 TaxID=2058332 RepID=UPI000C332874|nr:hypothetical protein [Paraglaciecola sp. MB-3u-78]PKG98080.1 hypothetical protein CXF95_16970 [Paraglaciecola sp. MB-3u-78]